MPALIRQTKTADGHRVEWRDDGVVYAVGTARRALSGQAAALVMSEICLYTSEQFTRTCSVAKRAVEQSHLPALVYFRATMNGKRIVYGRSAWGHIAVSRVLDAA